MPSLEERVTALELTVRNNELAERENYDTVRRKIADLGGLCAKSFLGMHHQLDRMESRMDRFETRIDRMESTMDSRFGALEADMAAVLKILHQQFGG